MNCRLWKELRFGLLATIVLLNFRVQDQGVVLRIEAKMKWGFKEEHSEEDRKSESAEFRSKYPDNIPVIVEKEMKSSIQDIDKRKFLQPAKTTVAQFEYIIRKRIQLPPEKPLFLFVNEVTPAASSTLAEVDAEHRDVDGFLYISYSGENTYGN
ncbi:gamma-aminobutyric acid receptor-associated protein-like 2 [Strongylocentrotus purpuratus]|uniref:Autophagy-related protein n=1 Tax=Strongylocentrotus purpuratus TaxID=7668 RepID=A0A7M7N609_STRPU|nr:gamma-aminobutyric acid receptor-associated protein-like 2 [Strongylocentrotus purpuratus]